MPTELHADFSSGFAVVYVQAEEGPFLCPEPDDIPDVGVEDPMPESIDECSHSSSIYEVPERYGENRITLLVRDPLWLFAYWDMLGKLPSPSDGTYRCVVRVFRTDSTGTDSFLVTDIPVESQAGNWYINVPYCDSLYIAELGRLYTDGTFIPIARSNIVHTPPAAVSEVLDEEWKSADDVFFGLYVGGLLTYMDGSEEHLKGKLVLAPLAAYMSSPMGTVGPNA